MQIIVILSQHWIRSLITSIHTKDHNDYTIYQNKSNTPIIYYIIYIGLSLNIIYIYIWRNYYVQCFFFQSVYCKLVLIFLHIYRLLS